MKNIKLADMSIEQLSIALNEALPARYGTGIVSGAELDDTIKVTADGTEHVLYIAQDEEDGTILDASLWDSGHYDATCIQDGICWDTAMQTVDGIAADIVARYL